MRRYWDSLAITCSRSPWARHSSDFYRPFGIWMWALILSFRGGLNLWVTRYLNLQSVQSIQTEKIPRRDEFPLSSCRHPGNWSRGPAHSVPRAGRDGARRGWQLVAEARYSRFRCVHGLGPMSDVLSAVEDSKGQATQEIPRGKQASHRSEAETSTSWEAKEKENWKPITGSQKGLKTFRQGTSPLNCPGAWVLMPSGHGFKSMPQDFLAGWSESSSFTALSLSFLICKMGVDTS